MDKTLNILFLCTSNKDRSPVLEQYFCANYPKHSYRSAGINKYFCEKKKTHYLTDEDIQWADLIVYAENIHLEVIQKKFSVPTKHLVNGVILNCGEYSQGCIGEDYLTKAEEKLKPFLI